MRFKIALLETRVARRMLGLFLLCAILPTAVLAIVGYRHVSTQLHQQTRDHLREASKATGMAIIGRLQLIDQQLRNAADAVRAMSTVGAGLPAEAVSRLEPGVSALAIARDGAPVMPLFGAMENSLPSLKGRQVELVAAGNSVLSVVGRETPIILMARLLDTERPGQGLIWAQLKATPLWGPAQEDAATLHLCVLAEENTVPLVCSSSMAGSLMTRLGATQSSGDLEWQSSGEERYVAAYWTAFLGYQWAAPSWTVVLSESASQVLAPMSAFNRTFLIVMVIALVLVFLLSNVQIRRHMEPLVRLQEGTIRVSKGDFFQPVVVTSGDEFQNLAGSFNTMANRLGRQFNALTVMNDISNTVLSELKTDRMSHTVLARFGEVLTSEGVSLMLRGQGADDTWQAITNDQSGNTAKVVRIPPGELEGLALSDHRLIEADGTRYGWMDAFDRLNAGSRFLLLPLAHEGEITGLIALAFAADAVIPVEDLTQARQLANQVAVALANTRLLERLEQLSWGTLSALAGTIDANSPWTAGHSERVTRFSLAIGKEMGLSARELDLLHRGGLLHDIGKIGIPSALLDKPGKLTDEEMEVVKSHTALGAKILAPISVFRDIIPIVRHHHEKLDGTGYPDRLAGDAIPFLARVVAVADVYDALVSDRPYRPGWTQEAALELMKRTASAHHDPVILDVFLGLIAKGELDQAWALPTIGETFDLEPALAGGGTL